MFIRFSGCLAGGGLAAALLLSVACGGEQPPGPGLLQVITTTALLADMAKNVGGESVQVTSIVPTGVDVHSFQTSPADSVAISRASVIVTNGGGLDDFLEAVIKGAKNPDAVRAVASAGVPLEVRGPDADPHYWQDPGHAVTYAQQIRNALITADPANAEKYRENTETYVQVLTNLDDEIAEALDTVPVERRRLITFHDAFQYLAQRYGWTATALVANDASQVTPDALAGVVRLAKEQGIPAVFAEPQYRPGVLETAAEEAGIAIGTIYSDVLDTQVTSYVELMRFNAKSLVDNLK